MPPPNCSAVELTVEQAREQYFGAGVPAEAKAARAPACKQAATALPGSDLG